MQRVLKNFALKLAGLSSVLLLVSLPVAGIAEQTSKYVDQTVVVFRADDILKHRLPFRTVLRNGSLVHGSQVSLACLGVLMQPGDLIAFLPRSKSCIPLSFLSASALRQELGYASVSGFERDKSVFRERLKREPAIVMEPLKISIPAGNVCVCPPPDPLPEEVFMDSFEDVL